MTELGGTQTRVRLQRSNPLSLLSLTELKEIWEHKDLALVLAQRDISSRYRQAVLGGLWAILQPLLYVAMLSIFLGRFAKVSSEGLPYFVFCFSGILLWQYLAGTVATSMMHLGSTANLLRKVYFPRLILPLAATIPQLIDVSITFVLTLLIIVFGYHIQLQLDHLVWLPLYALLALATAFGTVCWFQSLSILFFDMRHLIPLLMQLWMVSSPIMYPASVIPESLRPLYWLNPMATVIAGARWSLIGSGDGPVQDQWISVAVAAVLCITGMWFYKRVSAWFGDLV